MKLLLYIKILLFFSYNLYGQIKVDQIRIESGPTEFNIDQPFTIAVIVENSEERPSVNFPEFSNLEKRSMSVTSTMHTVGGKTILVQKIIQEYYTRQVGILHIEPFTVKVDDHMINQPGKELRVHGEEGLEVNETSHLEDQGMIIENSNQGDVFFSLSVSKKNVFVREGFTVRLSLFVVKSSPVSMEFYRLDQQMQSLLKRLRPPGCWEENLNITEIVQRETIIKNKLYDEYRMYEAVYFPLSVSNVYFPALTLKMLVAQKEGQEKLIDFTSSPFTVHVKALPPHPAKDIVAVGQFQLNEHLEKDSLAVGESFRYTFSIEGAGNIAAIAIPFSSLTSFDVYSPDVKQVVRRANGSITGEKSFSYMVVARQNGTFPLFNFFNWVYFDPQKAVYDTLSSEKVVHVVGNRKNQQVTGMGDISIYSNLELKSTSDFYLDYRYLVRWLINMIVILIFISVIWIYMRK